MSLFDELKRRSVFRVAIGYVGVSWLVLQVIDVLFGIFEYETDIDETIVIVLAIGFIPAMILAWVFELTPEGIKRDAETERDTPAMRSFGRRVDRVIIAILSVAVVFFAVDKFWSTEPVGPSIAVLPFENTSGDSERDAFATGMTDQMRTMLNSVRQLRVIADYSVSALIEEGASRERMIEELKLTHFLEGSVQTAGGQIRVTAILVNAKEGTQDWSATFDREMSDIFAIQDEIAAEVMSQLSFGDDQPKPPIATQIDLDAYKLYLQAEHLIHGGQGDHESEERFRQAIALLQQALAIEPDFIDGWLELSLASFRLWDYDPENLDQAMWDLSGAAFEEARRINDQDPVVLAWTAEFIWRGGGDTQEVADLYARAVEADPTEPYVLRPAQRFARSIGRKDKALAMAEFAVDRDPKCHDCWYVLSQVLRDDGRHEESRDAAEVASALGMDLEYSIAKTQLYEHNPEGMLTLVNKAGADQWQLAWGNPMALYTAGRHQAFEKAATAFREQWAETLPVNMAMIYAWSGNIDAAFEHLNRIPEQRIHDLQIEYGSPFFFNLHGDPRWNELLRRIERHPEQLAKIEFDPDIPAVRRWRPADSPAAPR